METALLDLWAGPRVSVHTLLGGAYRDRTEVHGSSAGTRTRADGRTEQEQTDRRLKLYAGRGELDADLDRLQAVRDAVDPDTKLFVDINTMWTPATSSGPSRVSRRSELTMLEQPLPPSASAFQDRLAGDLQVDRRRRVRPHRHRRRRGGRDRSATVINIGHSKLGGPTAALHAAQLPLRAASA